MSSIYPSPYRKYLYIAVTLVIAAAALYGAFLLGAATSDNTHTMDVKAIYDQGFTAGEASGMHKMQLQCANELAALRDNCKGGWLIPNMQFGNVNISETSVNSAR
jgi:hypothetical protein